MSDILASLSVNLGANVAGFKAGMAEARRELKGLIQVAEGMKDIGESLTKYVTLPLLALGGAGVKMAGDMEKAQASFTTMLGSAQLASQTLKELKQFAADTPFEFPEIQNAAKKLLAFNTPAKDLKETLRQLGDISAGIDAPIGEIADIYGKARVQGRLFQEDINQLTGRGIPIIQELAKQFGVSESAVRKLVETGKVNFGNLQTAFASLTSEGGKFAGLMQAQSVTLPGLFSTLKDNIGQSLAGIGQDIVDSLNLKEAVRQVGNFVKAAADSFAALTPEVKKFIVVGAGLAAALGPVLFGLGSIITLLPALKAGFATLGIESLAALGPILVPVAAIAAGAVLIYENWDQLRPVFAAAATAISAAVGQIKDILSSIDTSNTLGGLIKGMNLVQYLVNEIAVGVKALADVFGGTVGAIKGLLDGDLTTALNQAERAVIGLISPLANLLGFSKKTTFDDFFHLRDAVIAADEAAGNAALSGGDLAASLEKVGTATTALSDKQQKALTALRESLALNERLSTALGDSYEFVKGKQSALETGIKSLVSAGFDPAGKAVQKYVAQLKELNTVLGDNARLQSKQLEGLTKLAKEGDADGLGKKIKKNPLTGGALEENDLPKPGDLKTVAVDTTATEESLTKFNKFMLGFKASLQEATEGIDRQLASVFSGIGQAIGTALANGTSVVEAIGQSLIKALSDVAVQFGEKLILIGAGSVLTGDVVLGTAQIAAGTALVAGGAYLGAKGSSGGSGNYSSGATASTNFGSRANVGQAATQAIRVEVVGTLRAAAGDLQAVLRSRDYRSYRTN